MRHWKSAEIRFRGNIIRHFRGHKRLLYRLSPPFTMSTVGKTVWTPSAPDLPPPRLQFRSTDNCIFKVHDTLLFPHSVALRILLGDISSEDAADTILPINIPSDGFKLILHFVYNAETPTGGWLYAGHKASGVSLQTVQAAVLGCQQYMMHTIAVALEGPLRRVFRIARVEE